MANTRENEEASRQATQRGSGGQQQQSGQQSPQAMQRAGGAQSGQQGQTGMSRRGQFTPSVWASPFKLLTHFDEEMARLFEDFIAGRGSGSLAPRGANQTATWSPHTRIFERGGQLVVQADLPGMDRGDVDVEITDNAIILRGERVEEHEEPRDGGVYLDEITYGSFYREIPLPEGVDTSRAAATFNNGVLEITMPAPQRGEQRRHLEIQNRGQTVEQQQANQPGNGR